MKLYRRSMARTTAPRLLPLPTRLRVLQIRVPFVSDFEKTMDLLARLNRVAVKSRRLTAPVNVVTA